MSRLDDREIERRRSSLSSRTLVERVRMLKPLRIRDFRLLWAGLTVSMIGDGIYLVAIAWQVYELSNAPTALSLVGVAWTLPIVLFVTVGGVMTDRLDRRRVMISSDAIRGAAIAATAGLSMAGTLELWHLYALVVLVGVGEALFGPSFGAIVPDLVPSEMLTEANSLDQFVRPATLQFAGPAAGGVLIHGLGVDWAFLVDAGTFVVSGACLMLMTARKLPPRRAGTASIFGEMKEGLRFVLAHTWLWATLLSAAVSLLAFWGPQEVLVPFLVKNALGGDASDFGFVLAAGGAGSILAALVMSQRGLPRRHVLFMYVVWAVGVGSVALYGISAQVWQLMAASVVRGAAVTAGLVVWATLMHRLVPAVLLGRVTSLDWFVSIGLVPLSYAVTGPIAGLAGVRPTLLGAGILGALGTLVFLFVPGLRDPERDPRMIDAELRARAPEEVGS
jgi:MFS family permease